ncbi:QLQ domain-containing protein [Trichonephila clavipes]|nr:QLQ domain-containing protein [Trichonephila clavipes]
MGQLDPGLGPQPQCEPLKEFQNSSEISISSRTARRELKNLGFHGPAAADKPNITPQNAKHRLQRDRAHRHWTVEMWKTVLWSDESRFTVWQSDGRVWSPDLNPIEHLWDDQLRWTPGWTPMVIYRKLVESLPKRVQAVVHTKMGPTSY